MHAEILDLPFEDTVTAVEAAAVLLVSVETIRRKLRNGQWAGHLDRGARNFGWLMLRADFVKELHALGEHRRAELVEARVLPLRTTKTA